MDTPSPTEAVAGQLEALEALEAEVLRELLRLAELEAAGGLSQPALHAASASLRATLRRHAGLADELERLAAECDRPAEQEAATAQARRHRTENATLVSSLRELASKAQASRARHEDDERAALLGGEGEGVGTGSRPAARAGVGAARDVTESLRRTRMIMADELQRAEYGWPNSNRRLRRAQSDDAPSHPVFGSNTMRALDAQGKSLKDTLAEQQGVGSSLKTGKRALSKLQRRDVTDAILLIAACGQSHHPQRDGSHDPQRDGSHHPQREGSRYPRREGSHPSSLPRLDPIPAPSRA